MGNRGYPETPDFCLITLRSQVAPAHGKVGSMGRDDNQQVDADRPAAPRRYSWITTVIDEVCRLQAERGSAPAFRNLPCDVDSDLRVVDHRWEPTRDSRHPAIAH